jgi:hypothetical protein
MSTVRATAGETGVVLSCEHVVLTLDFLLDDDLQPWLIDVDRAKGFRPSPDLDPARFAADLFGWLADAADRAAGGERGGDDDSFRQTGRGDGADPPDEGGGGGRASEGRAHGFRRVWPHAAEAASVAEAAAAVDATEDAGGIRWWEEVRRRRTRESIARASEDIERLRQLFGAVEDGVRDDIATPADVIDLTNILHFSTGKSKGGATVDEAA